MIFLALHREQGKSQRHGKQLLLGERRGRAWASGCQFRGWSGRGYLLKKSGPWIRDMEERPREQAAGTQVGAFGFEPLQKWR